MKVVPGAGGVVILERPFRSVVLVVHRDPPELRLPKGMTELNESLRDTARREVLEETGLDCEVGELIGTARWTQMFEGSAVTKEVTYFLVTKPVWTSGGTDSDVRGLVLASDAVAAELLTFDEERRIVEKALAGRTV